MNSNYQEYYLSGRCAWHLVRSLIAIYVIDTSMISGTSLWPVYFLQSGLGNKDKKFWVISFEKNLIWDKSGFCILIIS